MNVYVWQRVENCSTSWHSEGGVVVVAADEDAARTLANAVEGCTIAPGERPDRVLPTSDDEQPQAFIFPDAGCC